MTKDRESRGSGKEQTQVPLHILKHAIEGKHMLYLMGSNTGFQCCSCIHFPQEATQRKAVHVLSFAAAPFPMTSLISSPFGAEPPAAREPAIQLPSWLEAWPDSLQYKGMACAFPFFRCLNLEYCQDPYRGQQEVQNMPEGMGTRAAGSKGCTMTGPQRIQQFRPSLRNE